MPFVLISEDLSRAKKLKGHFPVRIRVDFNSAGNRIQKYFGTGVNLSLEDFESVISERPKKILCDTSDHLVGLKAKAIDIIESIPGITPELFELYFTGKAIKSTNVENLFNLYTSRFEAA